MHLRTREMDISINEKSRTITVFLSDDQLVYYSLRCETIFLIWFCVFTSEATYRNRKTMHGILVR